VCGPSQRERRAEPEAAAAWEGEGLARRRDSQSAMGGRASRSTRWWARSEEKLSKKHIGSGGEAAKQELEQVRSSVQARVNRGFRSSSSWSSSSAAANAGKKRERKRDGTGQFEALDGIGQGQDSDLSERARAGCVMEQMTYPVLRHCASSPYAEYAPWGVGGAWLMGPRCSRMGY
jgi:hypothetical protein